MGELSILETFEPHKLLISSPKRSEKIQIIRDNPRFNFYKVLYESGKSIPELEGNFTSAAQALTQVNRYLMNKRQSVGARANAKYGDNPIPELKRKPVSKA